MCHGLLLMLTRELVSTAPFPRLSNRAGQRFPDTEKKRAMM
jgi:hypothetical protein